MSTRGFIFRGCRVRERGRVGLVFPFYGFLSGDVSSNIFQVCLCSPGGLRGRGSSTTLSGLAFLHGREHCRGGCRLMREHWQLQCPWTSLVCTGTGSVLVLAPTAAVRLSVSISTGSCCLSMDISSLHKDRISVSTSTDSSSRQCRLMREHWQLRSVHGHL